MKRLLQPTWRVMALLVAASALLFGCRPPAQPPPAMSTRATDRPQEVALTMGSWRTEDVQQMNRILSRFHAQHPAITIKFDPTVATEYNAVLRAQLEMGTAPDLFYLRSYATSRQLFDKGYLEPLNDLPGLQDNFTPAMLAPWATDDGLAYGVPFIATSHGIYYNINLFKKLNLQVPQTWQELLTAAQTIRANGVIPFANATGDRWTIAEIVFMNLAPNFIGGREGRMEYLTGKRCFNDAHIVAAFQAMRDLAPFLPEGHETIKYTDSQQLFLQGQAAMWMGGSWDIPFFEAEKPTFDWSVFAVPPPAGQPSYVTFQLDAGMGLDAASQHKSEARLFLEWMTTPEFARLLGDELPGFFPMSKQAPTLQDAHANAFLALSKARDTDMRFVWEKLVEGAPSGYDLVQDGAVAVIKGEQTPQQAADALQAGLAQWFEPARRCGK